MEGFREVGGEGEYSLSFVFITFAFCVAVIFVLCKKGSVLD